MNVSEDQTVCVSVIVPAYNAEDTIGDCLDAIVSQDCPMGSFEVVVVDDGSTDATPDILGRYEVRLIRQENRGPAAARNKGADEARGDILVFTDSDCVPDEGWLDAMLRPFAESDVAAVKGAYRTEQRSLVARFAQVEFEERYDLLEKAGFCDMLDTYSAAIRAEVFRSCDGFDETFPEPNNEDTELSYRLCAEGLKIAFARNAVVLHLQHPDSLRKYMRLKFKRGFWRMAVYKRYPGKVVRETYTPANLKLQIVALAAALAGLVLWLLEGREGAMVLIASLVLLAGAGLGLARAAWRADKAVFFALPVMILLRAAALGGGALAGAVLAQTGRSSASTTADNQTAKT